jgi:putative membrane protein
MMDWYDGMGWAGWLLGSVMMFAFWALIVIVIVALVRGRGAAGFGQRNPEQILDERFARGEIDIEEYTRRRELLRGGRDAQARR